MEEQVEIKVREPRQIYLWISLIPRYEVMYLIYMCSRICHWGPQILHFQRLYLGWLFIKDTYSECIETSGGHLKKNLWWRPIFIIFCWVKLYYWWPRLRGSECAGLDVGVPQGRFVRCVLKAYQNAHEWFIIDFEILIFRTRWTRDWESSVCSHFFLLELLQLIHNVEKTIRRVQFVSLVLTDLLPVCT